MSESKTYRVHYHSDEGPQTVECHGEQIQDGDRLRIGDCWFRVRDIINIVPVERAEGQ